LFGKAPVTLRHVHAYIRQPVRCQELQGFFLIVLGHPCVVAGFRQQPVATDMVAGGADVVAPGERGSGSAA